MNWSRLRGTRIRAFVFKHQGRKYECQTRFYADKFRSFCKDPTIGTRSFATPPEAEAALRSMLTDLKSSDESWLLVRIEGLSLSRTEANLAISWKPVLRSNIGESHERHKVGTGLYSKWEPGAPEISDNTERVGYSSRGAQNLREFLIRETPENLDHLRRIAATLEEVWFAWLALTSGEIELGEFIDQRGGLTRHHRPADRWSIETGKFPKENE